jgi:2-(1,2-epoxy-1,2-dihydrophenyl)acetyl-CoA isomerase
MHISDYQFINYTVQNRVATVALNSPKTLNALNQGMRMELIDVVARIEHDSNVRVAVVTGGGKAFCSGADLTEVQNDHKSFVEQCAAEYTPWLMGINDSKKLYVAAVNGVAAGIGSAVVMNCDLVMMAEDAYLYQAFSAIGLMPDGGVTSLLLNRVGYHRAIELAVDAGKLDAQQCSELGIANKVVASESLRSEAQIWAERLAVGAPLAQSAVKSLMRRASQMTYHKVIEEESVQQSRLIESEDSVAAIRSFFAKEKPTFFGK